MKQATGIILIAKDTKRILYLLRNEDKSFPCTWCFPGGKVECNETIVEGLDREIMEEVGCMPNLLCSFYINNYVNLANTFTFHTFLGIIEHEFIPILSSEHIGYAWCNLKNYPKPLHPKIRPIFQNKVFMNDINFLLDNLK